MGLCCPCRGIEEANKKSRKEAGPADATTAAEAGPPLGEYAQELPASNPLADLPASQVTPDTLLLAPFT